MTSCLDCGYTLQNSFRGTVDQAAVDASMLRTLKPGTILDRRIHGATEGFGPFYVSRVEMGMRNHDASESAYRFDLSESCQREQPEIPSGLCQSHSLHCSRIKVRDAVPENIAVLCAQ